MDLPDADIVKLLNTIRQFGLLNLLFTASRRIILEKIFPVMLKDPERHFTLLDMGAGGCDTPAWMIRQARQKGLRLSITALDHDIRIIPAMKEAMKDYPEIKVVHGSALDLTGLPEFDFMFSNHLLHHLDWSGILAVLFQAVKKARLGYVFNDIERVWWAYAGYTVVTGLFFHDSFAFHDGRLSIRKGFLPGEMRDLVNSRLPDSGMRVERYFPARIVVTNLN